MSGTAASLGQSRGEDSARRAIERAGGHGEEGGKASFTSNAWGGSKGSKVGRAASALKSVVCGATEPATGPPSQPASQQAPHTEG